MEWKKLISEYAVSKVEQFEKARGASVEKASDRGIGCDLVSTRNSEVRYIEVKGVSELWKTYTYQSLYSTEFDRLNLNPKEFFLYIVYFDISKENRNAESLETVTPSIFIIPGSDLLSVFKLKPRVYYLTPISQRKLEKYKVGLVSV